MDNPSRNPIRKPLMFHHWTYRDGKVTVILYRKVCFLLMASRRRFLHADSVPKCSWLTLASTFPSVHELNRQKTSIVFYLGCLQQTWAFSKIGIPNPSRNEIFKSRPVPYRRYPKNFCPVPYRTDKKNFRPAHTVLKIEILGHFFYVIQNSMPNLLLC